MTYSCRKSRKKSCISRLHMVFGANRMYAVALLRVCMHHHGYQPSAIYSHRGIFYKGPIRRCHRRAEKRRFGCYTAQTSSCGNKMAVGSILPSLWYSGQSTSPYARTHHQTRHCQARQYPPDPSQSSSARVSVFTRLKTGARYAIIRRPSISS